MEKASERAGNYQSSLLPTVLGINNQARWALGQLRSCRNSHGIFHSYTNGSKSFLWLSLPTNIKGALTAAGWQSKLSACRTQMTSCNWFHSQAITTQAINPVPRRTSLSPSSLPLRWGLYIPCSPHQHHQARSCHNLGIPAAVQYIIHV